MPATRKCAECGCAFDVPPHNPRQKYCSHRCANRAAGRARASRGFDADGRHRKWREAQVARDPGHFDLLPPPEFF